ncbi:hypothetical protein EZV62_027106 [Acer yangbiense]|uniref:Uncharacterized protein n=1 Tax=Acer yangbiense TaxID=1000413 RepID=A0A5C7GU14_9ROSI|nr:hypothetical protein EZV62_027106 [Acer yangbiense]
MASLSMSSTQTLSLHNNNRPILSYQKKKLVGALASGSSSFSFNPLRFSINCKEMKKGRGFGAVCYASPLTARNLQWISTISSAVLMLAKGTAVQKSFLVPLFALQAPGSVISWIKGDYGIWTAFLALLVRLFFFIPGRGTQQGAIISLVIAAYMAFQHFSRAGSLRKAFDQGSLVATLAIICITVTSCLFLV